MNELKFRAWDTLSKKYWYGNTDPGIISAIIFGDYRNGQTIVEQCTGLKDKNGNEIYEGDILKWVAYGCPLDEYEELRQTYQHIVKWFPGGFYIPYNEETEKVYEIIGNIHETANLFKEET